MNTTNLMGQSFIGRYARYEAVFSGDRTATPTLNRVEFGYSGSLPSRYRTFAFDPAGNITEKKTTGDTGATVINYTYVHDDNGNLTSKSDGTNTWSYTWDDENRLTAVVENSTTLATYQYDSNSRLLQRTADGTTTNYTWDGWDLIKEEKTGTVTETIRYAVPQGGVQSFVKDGDRYYLHGDGLSSTQLVTDETGAVVGRYIYGAWGEELHTIDSVPNGLDTRFVGGLGVRNDSTTGLIYMRYRWYDPGLQRFISRDPIGLSGDTNLYRYGGNSPVNWVDYIGLRREDWTNVKANPELTEKLIEIIKSRIPGYNSNPETTKAWNTLFKNIRFGDSKVKGKRGETFHDIIILENDPCDNKQQASELFHELLHRANNLKLFKIVPESLYTRGALRYGHGEEDAQHFARNHAWIFLQQARFGSTGSSVLEDMKYYDTLMNPGGQLDTDPTYLDSVINRYYKNYDFYGI